MHLIPSSFDRKSIKLAPLDVAYGFLAPVLAFVARDCCELHPAFFSADTIYVIISGIITTISCIYFDIGRILPAYFERRDFWAIARCVAASVGATVLVTFALFRLDAVPRTVPFAHLLVLALLMVVSRLALRSISLQRHGAQNSTTPVSESVIIVGCNHLTLSYIRLLKTCPIGHQRVLAIVDCEPKNHDKTILGYRVIGLPSQLSEIVREYRNHGIEIARVIVSDLEASPASGLWSRMQVEAEALGFELDYLPSRLGLDRSTVASDDRTPAAAQRGPAVAGPGVLFWHAKRLSDIFASVALLVLLFPVIAVVAGVIAVDIGTPTIFWQQRVGRGGLPVRIYKFRTLRMPMDHAGNEIPEQERISRIGHLLRRTRLDEIPQLYNILIGDMSLIGPRPLLVIDQPSNASVRLSIRPGLTGWAQVHGGKLLTPNEKSLLDEWYVRNTSLKVEFHIVLLTFKSVMFGDRHHKNDKKSPKECGEQSIRGTV